MLQHARSRYDQDVAILNLGTTGLTLLDHLHQQELLLLVDASVLGGNSGDVRVIQPDLDATPHPLSSVHQVGPLDTLTIAKRLYPELLPHRVVLITVESNGLDSQTETRACREVLSIVDREIDEWRRARSSSIIAGAVPRRWEPAEPAGALGHE